MSQDLHTPPAGPGQHDPLDALDQNLTITASDLLDRLWRFFISMRTGLALILGLGVLTLIGTLLKQAPEGVVADPVAYANFMAEARASYGGWAVVADKLGFFHMWTSWIYLALIVLLTTSLLACSANRAPRLWRHATRPRLLVADSFYEHSALRAQVHTAASAEQAADDAAKVLRAHHYRTLVAPTQDGVHHLYAERFRFGPFGTVISHVAFVVILLGAFLSATTGFREASFAAPVGSRVEVGHETGLSVAALSFTEAYYDDGSPKDYASEVILYQDGREVKRGTLRVNQPMSVGGVSFYQSFFGTAAHMKVTDGTGKVIYDQGVAQMWQSNDGAHVVGEFQVPGTELVVDVVSAASGQPDAAIRAGQVELDIQSPGSSQPTVVVIDQGKPTKVGGYTYTFVRPTQFTGLIVARDRGATVVWIGSLALVLGMFMVFFFPHRRIWVRIRPTDSGSTVAMASMLRRDVTFEAKFRQLATDIEGAENRRTTSGK